MGRKMPCWQRHAAMWRGNDMAGGGEMIELLNVSDAAVARRLLAVQIPAYRIEAELIGFYDIPPLRDTVATLQASGETFFGYYLADELVGAISYKREGETVDIHRLIVSPAHFRKGIASALLRYLLEAEAEAGATRFVVSTGDKNTPAKELYIRHGFTEVGRVEVAPGVNLASFVKEKERE